MLFHLLCVSLCYGRGWLLSGLTKTIKEKKQSHLTAGVELDGEVEEVFLSCLLWNIYANLQCWGRINQDIWGMMASQS